MEVGTIAQWELKEGDPFTAGTVFCSVETDKATMDFESQEDGFLAKILRYGSTASDIPIGSPIAVVVEEEEDVGAFADFVLEEEAPAATAAPAEASSPAAATSSPASERQVSDEYVLLPSARFLAQSKSVI
jgi:pyruvate/2-oxoglutarate dehydrogenase complex dihydrolipoamide acyltransferase (E2) component